jgi:hypothetical protein
MKRYIVRLTSEERQELERLVSVGKGAARKLTHARVLLQADAGADGPAWPDARVAEVLSVHPNTVVGIRHRFVEESLEAALNRKKLDRPSRTPRLDGRGEARLIALACSTPPEGRCRWTLQLLADKMVELKIVDRLSDETARRVLKKTCSSRT